MNPWKSPGLTPDECTYSDNAEQFRARGFASIRYACEGFALGHTRADLPPPTRWLWTVLVRWMRHPSWIGLVSLGAIMWSTWFAVPGPWAGWLIAWAPLWSWAMTRRLQDATVAHLTVLACLLAFAGYPVGAACVLAVLLCIKEGALLMLPAVVVATLTGGHHWTNVWPLPLAIASWVTASQLACGPYWLAALTRSVRSQRHVYTLNFQSGAPHRLLVDLALVSPWVLLVVPLASWRITAIAVAIVAAHMLSPVRNVRTILAADLLLRVAVGSWLASHGWAGLVGLGALIGWDVWLTGRMRGLRDTVTHALASSMGVVP